MQPIRIITPEFELKAEIDNYESMFFTRSWHGIGQFEMRINRYKKHVEHLLKGNLIMINPKKVFLIKHREIALDENGKATENWLIKGVALKVITGQRVTVPPAHTAYDNMSGDAETVMKHYVNTNLVDAMDPTRNMSQVSIAQNRNRGPNISWQSRYKNLAEELTSISQSSGLGWDLSLDIENKKWMFDVTVGRDLTVNQSRLPPIIFCPQFESLQSLHYTESDLNFKNLAYVGGQGEGTERRIVQVGEGEGLSRHEVFIDARDVAEEDDHEQPIPEWQIIQTLTNRGQQRLNELMTVQYLEGQILTKSPFKYEKDYDLGDIVTIQNKDWGVTMDARLTEMKEIYEVGGFKLEATFGNDRPTLIKKVKQELSQLSNEIRK